MCTYMSFPQQPLMPCHVQHAIPLKHDHPRPCPTAPAAPHSPVPLTSQNGGGGEALWATPQHLPHELPPPIGCSCRQSASGLSEAALPHAGHAPPPQAGTGSALEMAAAPGSHCPSLSHVWGSKVSSVPLSPCSARPYTIAGEHDFKRYKR